ncbi:MAG: hypothetical protein JWL81_3190 [Verrucomicrobiales bacterium]|nr:hypothetical protein [Verrucomicrobiales bacterium]
MKTKIAVLSLSLALAGYVSAADVYITGATAFRTAAIKAIASSYTGAFTASYNSGSLQTASRAAFSGSFPGISGTTNIYCSWNGSVEGVRALHDSELVTFIGALPTVAGSADGTGGGVDASTTTHTATFAFSDVAQSSSPFNTTPLYPSEPAVGVVAFAWVVNGGGDAGITGMTSQLAGAMLNNGFQSLRMFTGLAGDATKNVYLTGRNDGSGTRTTVLAESGFGISLSVQQWKPTVVSSNITELRLWPLADGTNVSNVWSATEVAGNGGFSSGGNLTTSMRSTSASVQRKNAAGTNVGSPGALSLIGYQSAADAFATQAAGTGTPGRLLKYNGAPALTYSGAGTPADPFVLSAAAINSIATGQYTLWGYENLYSSVDLSTDADLDTVYNAIKSGATAANLGLSGVPLSAMLVGRATDGGTVAP